MFYGINKYIVKVTSKRLNVQRMDIIDRVFCIGEEEWRKEEMEQEANE